MKWTVVATLLIGLPACASAPPEPARAAAPERAPAVAPPPPPAPEPAIRHRFAVSAETELAAEMAADILERGGSVADAAVLALLVSGVVQPASSGLGGGGFALHWDADSGRATFLDFRETAPFGLKASDFERPATGSRRGALVGVPGEAAGIAEMHRRWGKLPLAELFGRAASLAREGFSLGHHMHRALRWSQAWATKDESARALFAPAGRLLSRGERWNNPALARTLETLGAEGPLSFYRGALADDLIASAERAHGRLAPADLESYRVIERVPLEIEWNGCRILTAPPPSGGGLMLAETLAMHDPAELSDLARERGAYLHVMAETLRAALADRIRFVGDPAFMKRPVTPLLNGSRMKARRARIALDKSRRPESVPVDEGGTSSFVAVDRAGDVMVVSSSINDLFGARLMTAGGYPLNDQLANFSAERRMLRFRAGLRPNAALPGARPAASLAPTLVVCGGRPVLAAAASGGMRIPGALAQTLLASLLFERSASASVAELRIHAPPTGGLRIEPGASPELLADLQRRGEVVMTMPDYSAVSLVRIVERDNGRVLDAAADPRKGGHSLVR